VKKRNQTEKVEREHFRFSPSEHMQKRPHRIIANNREGLR